MNSTEYTKSFFQEDILNMAKAFGVTPEILADMLKLEEVTLTLKFPKFIIDPFKDTKTTLSSVLEECYLNEVMKTEDLLYVCVQFYIANKENKSWLILT